ncbi:flagellar assembly protein FliH [Rouxiella sp. WC2420]|uniref:Flagellar assembly protein FliH n=1 Tax=Rouxiella sp. WC2420 TaxID=3234145 RepID=A0AB39VRL6_9GAMM
MVLKNGLRPDTETGDIPRLYPFPPLRKRPSGDNEEQLDDTQYQQRLVEGFQDGVSQGFIEGNLKGRIEAQQIEKAAFQKASRPFSLLIEQMNQALAGHEIRRREELLQLVEKVTHQVIRCELALQPTQILALIDEALAGLPAKPEQLKIYLNPQEFQRIQDIEPEKTLDWGLKADPEMQAGECRIITESAELDIGCKHRLDQCMQGLQANLLPETSYEAR